MTEDLKAFLKSRLSAQYDGDVKTGDPFSLGLDVAQLQVSVGCGNALSTRIESLQKARMHKNIELGFHNLLLLNYIFDCNLHLYTLL